MPENPEIEFDFEALLKPLVGAFAQLGTNVELYNIFGLVTEEFWRARRLHGDQTDLPLGTGPSAPWLGELLDYIQSSSFYDATAVANGARDRCQAAHRAVDDPNGGDTWERILTEEYAELLAESDPAKFEAEAVQVIAMLLNAIIAARKTVA